MLTSAQGVSEDEQRAGGQRVSTHHRNGRAHLRGEVPQVVHGDAEALVLKALHKPGDEHVAVQSRGNAVNPTIFRTCCTCHRCHSPCDVDAKRAFAEVFHAERLKRAV